MIPVITERIRGWSNGKSDREKTQRRRKMRMEKIPNTITKSFDTGFSRNTSTSSAGSRGRGTVGKTWA
jgi:hypothetical protein